MIRAQVYLTEYQKQALSALSHKSRKTQSELIREAIDTYLSKVSSEKREEILDRVAGMWSERDESVTAESLRNGWART